MAIRRPGVEVVQSFQSAAAALNLPTLPSVMVGPGFEITDGYNAGAYAEGMGTATSFSYLVATAGAVIDLTDVPTDTAEANAHKPVGVSLSDAILVQKSTAVVGVTVAASTTFNDPTTGAFSGFDPDATGAATYWVEVTAGSGLDPADLKRHFIVSKTDDNNLIVAGEFVGSSTDVTYRILVERTLEVVPVADFVTRGIAKDSDSVDINPGLTSNDGLVVVEADILLSWRALRVDLAGALTVFTDFASLEAIFGVGSIVPANPGGYAVNLALLNTTTAVNYTGLTATFYTNEENAFTAAADYIEDKDVYGIAVLTHNTTVHQNFSAHVTNSSASTVGRERVAFINRKLVSISTEVPASGVGTVTSAGSGNGASDSTGPAVNNGKFRDPTNGSFITDSVGVGYFLEISSYAAAEGVQRSVTPNERDYIEDASGTSTHRYGNGAFTVLDVGRILAVQGATTLGNDIEYVIDALIDASKVETSATAIPGDEVLVAGTRTWVTTLDRAPAVTAADTLVAATKTWVFANGAFTSADVGRLIAVAGSTTPVNDGFFLIASVTNATTIVTEALAGTAGDDTFAGTETLRILNVDREVLRDLINDDVNGTNRNWEILGGAFTSDDVGRFLRIAGAANAGNNADHEIVEVISTSIVRTSGATTPVTEQFEGIVTPGVLTTLDIVSKVVSTAENTFITGTRHAIASISSESEVILSSDPTNGFGGSLNAVVYTITRDLSRTEEADLIAGYTSSFANRRLVHTWPDVLVVSIGGVSTKVPGYFAGPVYSGLTAGLPSQAGFTNLSIAGFTGRENSDDRFSDTQLDAIASGGSMILTQTVVGAPLITRHQLTTDTSTIFFQEFSVTKNVDLISRFFRGTFQSFIGIYNITDTLLDMLKTRAEAGITFLLNSRAAKVGAPIRSGQLSKIEESEAQPDSVEIELDIDVPLPLNNLKITILV